MVKAHKEAVAGFTLRIQQLAGMWVRLLEALDCAEDGALAPRSETIPGPVTRSVTVPTMATPPGPDWLPAFHVLLQESYDAIKVCVY